MLPMFPLSLWLLPQSNSWQSPDPWETWGWTFWAPSTAPLEKPLLVKAEFPVRRRRFPRMSVFHIWSGWQWDLWPCSRQHINTALNNKTIIASFNSDNVDNCLFLSSKSSLFTYQLQALLNEWYHNSMEGKFYLLFLVALPNELSSTLIN